jgi:hypothetical protein
MWQILSISVPVISKFMIRRIQLRPVFNTRLLIFLIVCISIFRSIVRFICRHYDSLWNKSYTCLIFVFISLLLLSAPAIAPLDSFGSHCASVLIFCPIALIAGGFARWVPGVAVHRPVVFLLFINQLASFTCCIWVCIKSWALVVASSSVLDIGHELKFGWMFFAHAAIPLW